MVEVNFMNLYFYLSQSLLGFVTDNIRAISFKFKNEHLQLYVYLANEESDLEKENMFSVLSETESVFSNKFNYNVTFIVKKDKLTQENKFDSWLFMRYE